MLNKYTDTPIYSKLMSMNDVKTFILDIARDLRRYYALRDIQVKITSDDESDNKSWLKGNTLDVRLSIIITTNDDDIVTEVEPKIIIPERMVDILRRKFSNHQWMIAQWCKTLLGHSFGHCIHMRTFIGKAYEHASTIKDVMYNSSYQDIYINTPISFGQVINDHSKINEKWADIAAGLTLRDYAVTYANYHGYYEMDGVDEEFFKAKGLYNYLRYEEYCMMIELFESREFDVKEEN